MPGDDYCRSKVALPGSSLYYSVLFADPAVAEALVALHAFAEEIREITDQTSDEAVARRKLGWWAEEIQRAAGGEPRHPVSRALAATLPGARVDAARFAIVLEAAHAHVTRDAYPTLEALEAHHDRMAEVLGPMAADACGFTAPETAAVSRDLGVGLALVDLASAPGRAGAGRATDLPAELLAPGAPSALGAPRADPALAQALGAVGQRARERLAAYLDAVPAADRATQAPRRALAAMGVARLDALARAGYAVLDRPPSATPLRKLWIAWKHRRR